MCRAGQFAPRTTRTKLETMATTLQDLLERHNISGGFTPIPERTDGLWEDHDGPQWSRPLHFSFTLAGDHGGISGCYSAGVGNLKSYRGRGTDVNRLQSERRRFRPSLLDLVYSLLLDASIDPETSFGEWCDDMGHGLHPGRALETYNALRSTREKMRRIFRDDFDTAVALAIENY